MIALLLAAVLGLATAGEVHGAASVRYRLTYWAIPDGEGWNRIEIPVIDPATGDPSEVVGRWDREGGLYQIVDADLRLSKKLRIKALLDSDPAFRELLRVAGEVGWERAVVRVEGGAIDGSVTLEGPDVPVLGAGEVRDAGYRMIGLGARVRPGVILGMGWWRLDHPEAWWATSATTRTPLIDVATRHELIGVWVDLRLMEALLGGADRSDIPGWVAEGGRTRAGIGLEGGVGLGPSRIRASPPVATTASEALGWPVRMTSNPGLGIVSAIGVAGAVVWDLGDSAGLGLTVGLEERTLLFMGPASEGDPRARELLIQSVPRSDFGMYSAFQYGPYAGIGGYF